VHYNRIRIVQSLGRPAGDGGQLSEAACSVVDAGAAGSRSTSPHRGLVTSGLLIGYARVSTEEQDLTAQRDGLAALGDEASRIYVDHGLTGTNRERPGLREALAACRAGETLVVTKLDRLARSLPDGRLLFNVLAMVAEFEADLIRSRTREGMRVAKAKGHLREQAAQAQPAPGSTPGRAAAQRRVQHRRTRRPVRRGPLHRVPRGRSQQADRRRPRHLRRATVARWNAPEYQKRHTRRGERRVPSATRRTQRAAIRKPAAFSGPNRAPGEPAANGTLNVSDP
jgi:DNA invertase Pin-like site-specific DNA recombinase